jgi:hypothetical protein
MLSSQQRLFATKYFRPLAATLDNLANLQKKFEGDTSNVEHAYYYFKVFLKFRLIM